MSIFAHAAPTDFSANEWFGIALQSAVTQVNPLKGLVFYTNADPTQNMPPPEAGAMSSSSPNVCECFSVRTDESNSACMLE